MSKKIHKVPSLVDLCVQVAIDNVRYLGDVGETDFDLLNRILPHCSLDQLMHIENLTTSRDLSPVTDELWKKLYTREFGVESTKMVIERMRKKQVTFKWRQLYDAKLKEREEATEKSLERVRQRYQEAGAKKQSRQVQLCTKAPPSSKRRNFEGISGVSNAKGGLMKKAKLEFLKCREVRNLTEIKKQLKHSASSIRKPAAPSTSTSTSKVIRPVQKRSS